MSDEKTKPQKSIMNKDLQAWAKEATAHDASLKNTQNKDQKKEKKTPQGACEICGEELAKNICTNCNRSVCNTCYFQLLGLCEYCIPADTVKEWKTPKTKKEEIDPETKEKIKEVLEVDWVD